MEQKILYQIQRTENKEKELNFLEKAIDRLLEKYEIKNFATEQTILVYLDDEIINIKPQEGYIKLLPKSKSHGIKAISGLDPSVEIKIRQYNYKIYLEKNN